MNKLALEAQLEDLLSEDIISVTEREKSTFDRLVSPFAKSLVLFGAGNLGRKMLTVLRQTGIEPLAFADNNRALWGTSIDGLQVLSPQEAAQQFGQRAAFVVAIFNPFQGFNGIREQLEELNCLNIISGDSLCWKYPDTFLPIMSLDMPHGVYQQGDDVRKCLDLWADEASRLEYMAQLKWRMRGDHGGLPSAPISEAQYLPENLFSLSPNEVFVDCGAYDGDTVRSFIKRYGSSFGKIVALEPDAINFHKLCDYILTLNADVRDKVIALPLAAGARRETLCFKTTGTASSMIETDGIDKVECAPLDDLLSDMQPTYIKMDIEGAEPDALLGARRTIERHAPVLAVCVYHQQDHLWRLPLLIQSLSGNYRFFLRRYNPDCWDVVCYAVPEDRLAA